MTKNWIKKTAEKADISEDIAILTNSVASQYLDGLLLETYWPSILQGLKDSGYYYLPQENPKVELELSYKLQKSLSFMLFEDDMMFYRGTLSCTREHWMLSNEFYLFLAQECEPKVVLEILGNSRFRGYPPELSVNKTDDNCFYEIKLKAGKGASWGYYDKDHINDAIQKAISTSAKMHDFSSVRIITSTSIGEFLSMAYEIYESF